MNRLANVLAVTLTNFIILICSATTRLDAQSYCLGTSCAYGPPVHHTSYFQLNEIPVNIAPISSSCGLGSVHASYWPPPTPVVNACADFKDVRVSLFGPSGFLVLQPVIEGKPRFGEGSVIVNNNGLAVFEMSEIVNAPSGFMYFKVNNTNPPDSPLREMIVRIACKPTFNGRFAISTRLMNATDFKFLMHAQLSTAYGTASTAGFSRDLYERSSDGTADEILPPPSISARRSKLSKVLANSPRKAGFQITHKYDSVIRNRRPAPVLSETDVESEKLSLLVDAKSPVAEIPAPRTRMPIRGRWHTPAVTKLIAHWDDGDSRDQLQILQEETLGKPSSASLGTVSGIVMTASDIVKPGINLSQKTGFSFSQAPFPLE